MHANRGVIGTLFATTCIWALPALAQDCEWEGLDATARAGGESRRQMVVYDDGRGPALYVAAGDLIVDGENLGLIARFDGDAWSAVGHPGRVLVSAMDALDLGDGTRLYAAFGDGFVSTIHVLEGEQWVPFSPELDGVARTLTAFDDGSGPLLYASGEISTDIDGRRVRGVVRLEDDDWAGFGSTGGADGVLGVVGHMVVYDDGRGAALYLGGDFVQPDDPRLDRGLVRWDGAAFSVIDGSRQLNVQDMLVFDDGDGEALYIGGASVLPGLPFEVGVVKWDGVAWDGLGDEFDDDVLSLAAFDRGDGSSLYAGGRFGEIGDREIESIARWDGAAWQPLEQPLEDGVIVIEGWDDGGLRGLYAVGGPEFIEGRFIGNVPRWPGCLPCQADLDGDGELTIFDFFEFQNLFDAADPRADFDGDGSLTIFDFLAFQSAFDAGC
ncbi:MAG: GC-type dockerin domain-anchored protein [Planctomycetota bacterium]